MSTPGTDGTVPVVIVTGGGSGIGAATAAAFARVGYHVVVAGRRRAALESVAGPIGATVVVADLTAGDDCTRLIDATLASRGRLDCLVLNAGLTREGPFEQLTDDDWSAMLATNLVSAARLARGALPALRRSRGSIVGVGSVAALRTNAIMSGYSASKAGLVSLIQSIAVEYAAHGVRANAVCPGWVRTEMADEELGPIAAERGISLEETYDLATSLVPIGRAARPEEVAAAILFLASPAASYITGAALPVDGGSTVTDVGALAL
jgi:meso-butanediol dehydrogenase/(S,S)-butanediol dehydrogenase/diacetyl reductase